MISMIKQAEKDLNLIKAIIIIIVNNPKIQKKSTIYKNKTFNYKKNVICLKSKMKLSLIFSPRHIASINWKKQATKNEFNFKELIIVIIRKEQYFNIQIFNKISLNF
jgi:hypothetical protein